MNDITQDGSASQYSAAVKTAIILAGGLGTRLRSAVADLPKCMAPVAGRPFLFYVINHLRLQGIEQIIFSLGYKHEAIEQYLAEAFPALKYTSVVESEPMGTGGAIRLASENVSAKNILVANGDTLFTADIQKLINTHTNRNAECTLALKPMQRFDRYGAVQLAEDNTITGFEEKQYYDRGLINGGLYVLNVEAFRQKISQPAFSFEKDYLEKFISAGKFVGVADDSYFIDIGIPDDYHRAQDELKQPAFKPTAIDKSWTLFLDRDGVFNHDKVGSYVFHPDEFRFYDGVPEAMKTLSDKFGLAIVTTNQRGVGRGLMSEADLHVVNDKMKLGIEQAGGRIDAIFFATAIDYRDFDRKPNPGMAIKARQQFPAIDFSRSVMVGNNISDMQFGRNAGMYTVFLKTTQDVELPHPDIDMAFNSLPEFAKAL